MLALQSPPSSLGIEGSFYVLLTKDMDKDPLER
jgi:hypothetical protein